MAVTKPWIGVDTVRCNYDTVDDETVILDATTGVLTLLVGLGPLIWERLVGGIDRGSLVAEVVDTYGDRAGTDVESFVDALLDVGLVVAVADIASGPTPTPWPKVYVAPEIERYEDIADIMTMDPIHEVDKTLGWPRGSVDEASDSV